MANHTTLTSLFTAIADAIRAKAGTTETIVADDFPAQIAGISTGLPRLVTNDDSIEVTGTYATSAYYNTTYGVKIGYCPDGSILLSMQTGTSANYETPYFTLASAPDGVTITEAHNASTSYVTGKPGLIYACVLNGITSPVTISVAVGSFSSNYDYVKYEITVTEA